MIPRALTVFRRLINERSQRLREQSFAELERLVRPPMGPIGETVTIESRRATIVTVVEQRNDGRLRVVVQGTMDPRLLPVGFHVAVDGFYKHPDGSVTPMPDTEYREFD
jgi:hypothetical protein